MTEVGKLLGSPLQGLIHLTQLAACSFTPRCALLSSAPQVHSDLKSIKMFRNTLKSSKNTKKNPSYPGFSHITAHTIFYLITQLAIRQYVDGLFIRLSYKVLQNLLKPISHSFVGKQNFTGNFFYPFAVKSHFNLILDVLI